MKFNLFSKKSFSSLINLLLGFFVLYTISSRIPNIVDHFKMEKQSLPEFAVPLTDGTLLNSQNWNERKILVFWATWCGPCEIELGRLNKMIKNGKIKSPNSVIAISSYEDAALVNSKIAERDYKFKVGLDSNGSVGEKFKINGTPTVIFVDAKANITWITTGLSPLLEVRANSFLND